MHIPDGFLDGTTSAVAGGLAMAGLGLALLHLGRTLPQKRVPLLGLTAAFVFAGQMLNFPIGGGTSGHLIGAVLTGALLGPSAAVVVLSAVLIVQALLFGDGGLLVLGANIFNLAVVAGAGGYMLYRLVGRLIPGRVGQLTGVAFAAWSSTMLAATFCAAQLATSGTIPADVVFPAMLSVHAFIGVGEAAITALVFAAVLASRPEVVDTPYVVPGRWMEWVAAGLLISLGLVIFASPFASEHPDGLEFVAEERGFIELAADNPIPALIPDYKMPGISSEAVATGVAGAIGTVVMFGLCYLMALALVKGRRAEPAPVMAGP